MNYKQKKNVPQLFLINFMVRTASGNKFNVREAWVVDYRGITLSNITQMEEEYAKIKGYRDVEMISFSKIR